jgi:hypothetical protein
MGIFGLIFAGPVLHFWYGKVLRKLVLHLDKPT